MDPYAEIRVDELGIKSRSKKEVYDLLAKEGDIYLPPPKDAHHQYISQIMTGEKLHLKCSSIKVCRVPQLKGLYVEDLLKEANSHLDIQQYLPDYEYDKLPNRQFLCNIMNTLLGEKFKKFMNRRVQERVKSVVTKKRMTFKAPPEFIDIFKSSENISVQKGRSHYLIKRSEAMKWDGLKEPSEVMLNRERKRAEKLNEEVRKLTMRLDETSKIEKDFNKNSKILTKLYNQKVIDSDGNLI